MDQCSIKNQVIRITVFVNPSKLGRKVVAFIGLQVDLKNVDSICSQVSGYPEVESVMMLTSGYNIMATVVVPDLKSLYGIIVGRLAGISGIHRIDPLIRAELIKRTYMKANIEDIFRS
jgi:DNA-binding Lrp family transcriptional regulator